MVLFLSILFYLLIKNRKIFLPCLALVLAVFTKETSIALLPVLLFYYIFSRNSKLIKNKKQAFYLWITVGISSAVLILITFLRRSGYSTNYYFDVPMLVSNLIFYFKELSKNTLYIFPLIPIIYLIRMGVRLVKKQHIFKTKMDVFEFLFFASSLCFLAIQLPWKFVLTRYLMPTVFFLTGFLFIETHKCFRLLSKLKFIFNHNRVSTFILTILGIYVSLIWGLELIFRETSIISVYDAFKIMANYPENTILLMNLPRGDWTIELVYETQIHLSEFWNRNDLKVDYLDLKNLPKNNFMVVDFGQSLSDKFNPLFKNKPIAIESVSKGLVITTPLELIKQTAKKIFNLLIYKKTFTTEGLYTYYYNYDNWYFYNE
jgi:hypothetical protein